MSAFLDVLHQPHAQLLLRLVLGGLLLLAGVTKLADREAFREAVAEYAVLPRALERPFAALLPWLEVSLGTLLLLGLGTTAAAALAMPLFLSFALAIGVNLRRGRHLDCHCFGAVQSEQIGWATLLRSAVFALAALTVALGTSRFGALEHALFGSAEDLPSAAEVVPMVFVAAVVVDVLILLPEALAFRSRITNAYRVRITGVRHNGRQPETARTEVRGA